MKKSIITVVSILLLLIVWGYFNIWRSPKYFLEQNNCNNFSSILTMQQYGELSNTHDRPYIIEKESVLVFGSEHTKDSKDNQLKLMDSLFHAFKPTVVLVEGRLGFFIPYIMDPVKKFGEMGKVAELADKENLSIFSWETPKSELIEELNKNFKSEQIAIKEILTPYFSNLRFGKPKSPENFVLQYIDRAQWFGLQDKISSIRDIDSIWEKDFKNEKDWRDTSDQFGLPGYLSEIGDYANYVRNQNLVCSIKTLVDQNERVFVVCGSSHAVCIEKEI